MKKNKCRLIFYALVIAATVAVVGLITFFFTGQMNRSVSNNIINSINELAEHDKTMIKSYINIYWEDLTAIAKRFESYECRTIEEVEERMNLECATSRFRAIYLLAEDGTIYTNTYVTFAPGSDILGRSMNILPYFENGEDKVFVRFDDKISGGFIAKESLLYGVRLKDYEVQGIKMIALVGISDITLIQDHMVLENFRAENGAGRGYSTLIDMDGNYIVDSNKDIYLNSTNNLYRYLDDADSSDLTNEEIAEKIENKETFGFYYIHQGNRKFFYLIPFDDNLQLYFVMSVDEEVFNEQSRDFVTTSMGMLVGCMTVVGVIILLMMLNQRKVIRATERARSQKEFLSNMSHEIRTPLNGLIGLNHLIAAHIDDAGQKKQIKEWLQKSDSTAHYLLSLVNDILDISKLQAGKIDLTDEPLLVNDLVDEVCAMQKDNIEHHGVKLIVEKDISVPCVMGDAVRIKQILMNIIGNAAKFTPAGGSITVSVRQKKTDDTHVITTYQCADTGIGISKEYLGKIFDSFSQEKNNASAKVKGTGLGMAISKLLTDAMGGEIAVESELEVGSVFTVTIPSALVDEIPDSLQEIGGNADHTNLNHGEETGRPLKILIAEDVELNAEVLVEILHMEGFETSCARNGEEAVRLFAESAPGEFGIILMDMQMPVMDGCTAAGKIRALDRKDAKTVLIYACTANSFQEDREQALSSGMDDFLTKPIDVSTMLKKIKQRRKTWY